MKLQFEKHRIQFIKTNFTRGALGLHLKRTFRETKFVECNGYDEGIFIYLKDKNELHNHQVVAAVVTIEESYFDYLGIYVHAKTPLSFVQLNLLDSVFVGSWVSSLTQPQGLFNIWTENCTFVTSPLQETGILLSRGWLGVLSNLHATSSDGASFGVRFEGIHLYHEKQEIKDMMEHILYYFIPFMVPKVEKLANEHAPFNLQRSALLLHDSQFEGQITATIVFSHFAQLGLSSCEFAVSSSSLFALIYARLEVFSASNVTIHAIETEVPTTLLALEQVGEKMAFSNVLLLCPKSQSPSEQISRKSRHYRCKPACQKNSYTLDTGAMTLHGNVSKSNQTSVSKKSKISCFSCPLGANCKTVNVLPLPNYWGYKNKENQLVMLRCPEGYCCSGNDTCEGIDSCNTGRKGTLCGRCKDTFCQSLLVNECVPDKDCNDFLIIGLYIASALTYALALLSMEHIKQKILQTLKTIMKNMPSFKRKSTTRNTTRQQTKTSEDVSENSLAESLEPFPTFIPNKKDRQIGEVKKDEMNLSESECGTQPENTDKTFRKETNSIKYIQILFYYIQDASLFKVSLPQTTETGTETFAKILEFSPQVVFDIFKAMKQLCFSGSTMITKVVFMSLFGPTVMLCIFFIFIGQQIVSCFVKRDTQMWVPFRAKLLQAFLFALLFSFQKTITGAFSLVHCVPVEGDRVLHVQGDVVCYHWWQLMTIIFLCVNFLPIAFVLSHTVFQVQSKNMSVRSFILACVFPLPVILAEQIMHLKEKLNTKNTWCTKNTTEEAEPPQSDQTPSNAQLSETEDIQVEQTSEKVADQPTQDQTEEVEETGCLEEAILETLLKHYKCLNLFGFHFTWFLIHKLYRFSLVVCYTFVIEPITRLSLMSIALVHIALGNVYFRPYKDSKANKTATLSYMANLCIAMINLWKTALATFGCDVNCSFQATVFWYFDMAESILLKYAPIAGVTLLLLCEGIQKLKSKTE